jgi:hypothetical protein
VIEYILLLSFTALLFLVLVAMTIATVAHTRKTQTSTDMDLLSDYTATFKGQKGRGRYG